MSRLGAKQAGRQTPQLRLRCRHVQRQLNCAFAVAIVQTIVRLQSSKLAGNVVPRGRDCFPNVCLVFVLRVPIPVHALKARLRYRSSIRSICRQRRTAPLSPPPSPAHTGDRMPEGDLRRRTCDEPTMFLATSCSLLFVSDVLVAGQSNEPPPDPVTAHGPVMPRNQEAPAFP